MIGSNEWLLAQSESGDTEGIPADDMASLVRGVDRYRKGGTWPHGLGYKAVALAALQIPRDNPERVNDFDTAGVAI